MCVARGLYLRPSLLNTGVTSCLSASSFTTRTGRIHTAHVWRKATWSRKGVGTLILDDDFDRGVHAPSAELNDATDGAEFDRIRKPGSK